MSQWVKEMEVSGGRDLNGTAETDRWSLEDRKG